MHYPEWQTILENDYSLQIASEDAFVTKETQKFLRLFDRAISMITGQPNGQGSKCGIKGKGGAPSCACYKPVFPVFFVRASP